VELVLASNFDDALVERTRELPVAAFFGNFPITLTGGGRPPHILPSIDRDRFRAHVAAVHRRGRRFYATVNSSDLGLREYATGFAEAFLHEIGARLDDGVDGFVVALPLLIEMIHREHPAAAITVSTFARVRTVTQAEYFLDLGADTVVLEEANRDFALVRGLVARGVRVEILVNQTCLPSCPYRAHHLNTSSLAAQPGRPGPAFELPILQCGLELLRDPARLLSGIFVRPEDLAVYEAAGADRFKVSGRNRSTDWLVRAATAYAARRYPGDLIDLLSFVQAKGPTALLQQLARAAPDDPALRELSEGFARLARLSIDNTAFPAGWLDRIARTDCEHTSCRACGWCASVARRVIRIDGRPLAEYRPPGERPLAYPWLAKMSNAARHGSVAPVERSTSSDGPCAVRSEPA
jgi:collagenase-like PrtC family protease